MNDAARVGGIEGVGRLDACVEQVVEGEWSSRDTLFERVAVEKFHGDEGLTLHFVDFVDGADVGMIQGGGGTRFALKALERGMVAGHRFGKKFQRDGAVELHVDGAIDDTHPAAADLFDNAVMRDSLTDHAICRLCAAC